MGKLSEIYNGGPNETDIKDFLYKKLVQEKDFEIGCNGVLVPWDPPVRKPPCWNMISFNRRPNNFFVTLANFYFRKEKMLLLQV